MSMTPMRAGKSERAKLLRRFGVSIFVAWATVASTTLLVAPAAKAQTVNIDIGAEFAPGSEAPVSRLDESGITFTGTVNRVYINRFQPWITVDGNNRGGSTAPATLLINVQGGQGISLRYRGAGDCRNASTVTLKSGGLTVRVITIANQCIPDVINSNVDFDLVEVSVPASEELYIETLSFEILESTSASDVLAPAAPLQGLPMPTTGQCTDVDESQLTWGQQVTGGWQKSWEVWLVSNGVEEVRWEGWACIRAIEWRNSTWQAGSL